jgi:AraC-like DNA-binding protein
VSAASSGTFSATILRAFARALGLDPCAALADSGIDDIGPNEPDARVPLEAAFRFFDEASLRTGVGHAGLLAAMRTPPGALGLIDLVVRVAPTFGEVMARFQRYYTLIDDRTILDSTRDGSSVRMLLRNRVEMPPPRASCEYLFGLIGVRYREYTGLQLQARSVAFAFPTPDDQAPYRELFGPELHFGQPYTELEIDTAIEATPCRTADPVMSPYLEHQADTAIRQLPLRDTWLDQARAAVLHTLATDHSDLGAVAKRLALSPRTLQRRLQEAGTSHHELIDAVRCELGIRRILAENMPVAAIAEELGFSDTSSFHRAFKRWTGLTPRSYRLGLRGR